MRMQSSGRSSGEAFSRRDFSPEIVSSSALQLAKAMARRNKHRVSRRMAVNVSWARSRPADGEPSTHHQDTSRQPNPERDDSTAMPAGSRADGRERWLAKNNW